MAGNYPDPPGNRLPYDRDGTLLFGRKGGSTFDVLGEQLSATMVKDLNGEGTFEAVSITDVLSSDPAQLVSIFPSLRDITHVHYAAEALSGFQWSPDTTNGVDGTWNSASVLNQANSRTSMRTNFSVVTITGAKAVRWWNSGNYGDRIYTLHLYGKPTTPGDRLVFWHPTLDQPLRDTPGLLDWGDRPRNTQATKQVRVKNQSGALTAQGVTVGMEVLTDATPSLLTQHEFSLAGGPFASSVALGDLTPGQISGLIEVRQTLTLTSALSLWDQRLVADATGWV